MSARTAMRERRSSKTVPAAEGEKPASHRVKPAGLRVPEIGADAILPGPDQQMALRVTELEAALKLVISSHS